MQCLTASVPLLHAHTLDGDTVWKISCADGTGHFTQQAELTLLPYAQGRVMVIYTLVDAKQSTNHANQLSECGHNSKKHHN